MIRLILIRHGQVTDPDRCHGQRSDPSLSPEGRLATMDLAARTPVLDLLVTSPARRAVETAEPLATARRRIDAAWAERNFGEWEGQPWAQLWADQPASVTADPAAYLAFTPPGAETANAVDARVRQGLAALVTEVTGWSNSTEVTVGVVSHEGPIRAAIAACLGLDPVTAMGLRPERGTSAWLRRIETTWLLERFGW